PPSPDHYTLSLHDALPICIVPIAHNQDTAGPMCRTVTDAAIMLGALTGIDARDNATKDSAGKSFADYKNFLDVDGLKGARIGVRSEEHTSELQSLAYLVCR